MLRLLIGFILGAALASAAAEPPEHREFDCPPGGKIMVNIYAGGGAGGSPR